MRPYGLHRIVALQAVWGRSLALVALVPFAARAADTTSREPPASDSSIRQETRHMLRDTFQYDPSIRRQALIESESGEDVVQLEPFIVEERKRDRLLMRHLKEEERKAEASKPGVASGVTVPGVPQLGVTRYEDVIPFGPSIPRWNILKIDW